VVAAAENDRRLNEVRALMDGRGRDQGASSIEWAILTPILVFVMLYVVQFGMIYHAQHIALSAAQAGARNARQQPEQWDPGAAQQTAQTAINQLGPSLLSDVTIVAEEQDGYTRSVVVTGTAVNVFPVPLPFLDLAVTKTSQGAIECFRPDVGEATECEEDPE
jgi:Flp pilus assembly protein TadG